MIKPYYSDSQITIYNGDALAVLQTMAAESIQCCVTSPPYYGLRDYGVDGQIGLEETPELFIARLVNVFREVRRVLKDDGVCFVNIGDSYFGSNQTGGTKSKEGSAKRLGRMFSNARRVDACGTSDRAQLDSQDHGCLCGNLCGVCRVVYQSRKSHKDGLLVAMLTASLSGSNLEHTEFSTVHLPTSDLAPQVDRIASAIQDQERERLLVGERLRVVLLSTIGESSPQLLAACLQRACDGECLLCERSLLDCAQVSVDSLVVPCENCLALLSTQDHLASTDDSGATGGSLGFHKSDKVYDSAYPNYTTPSRHLKPKDLIGIPWMLAFALRADGWYLRQDIIWSKPNPMPESVTDRCTKSHEYIFLLSKSASYFYDNDAVMEAAAYDGRKDMIMKGSPKLQDGKFLANGNPNSFHAKGHERWQTDSSGNYVRNRRSVWSVPTKSYSEAHFATFPPALIEPCILAGSRIGDTILDPFGGSGTTAEVANRFGRKAMLIELNPEYCKLAMKRNRQTTVFAACA